MVFQDVVLFNNTILVNIRIGRKNASDEEVRKAAELSGCMDFIGKTEGGFSAYIGENGASLSGGERQRISIARAFLKDSPILLLDEITSGLDVGNEYRIQESLKELMKGRTVIIISHRIKSIENADNIIVLDNGVVESEGKHEDLIIKSHTYRSLCENARLTEEFLYQEEPLNEK